MDHGNCTCPCCLPFKPHTVPTGLDIDFSKLAGGMNIIYTSAPKGWECPKCGRVYAPFVAMCAWCVPPELIKSLFPESK